MTELKRNEVLSFDDGLLTVKMSGHGRSNGWATLAFNEQQFELNDEGYQVVEIAPSELYEIRDFLNRVLTERPGDRPATQGDGDSADHCEKCGCQLNGEAALVRDAIWCHPCADKSTDTALQK